MTDARPIRGRTAQLDTLERQLKRARSGTASIVVIEGGAGLGKTALLRAAVDIAAGHEFRAGLGTADTMDGAVDLAPVYEALFDGDTPLLDRTALGDIHTSPRQRFWLLRDIETLLEKAAQDTPLLICLDDLQWADSGTIAALRSLPPRMLDLPIMWAVATRPEQGSVRVRSVVRELLAAGAERLPLEPLSQDAVEQIVVDILGAPGDENLLRTAGRIHANPFLLVEFLRGLKEEGLVVEQAGRAAMIDDRLPGRLSDDMRKRLSRVPAPADHVATCASSLGRRFSVTDLATLSGLSVGQLAPPLRELIQADILVESGERLAFAHDLIRGAVRVSLPVAVRRALDRKGAEVLLARGAPSVEVATQLAASADPGDDVAIAALLNAADALSTTDPAASADLAERALRLTAPRHPLRGPIVSRRAVSLFAAGLCEEAKRFADTALRRTLPPEQEAEVRLGIARMYSLSPDLRADTARQALELPRVGADTRGWLAGVLFHSLVVGGRTDEARLMAARLREIANAGTGREGRFTFELAHAGLTYQLLRLESAVREAENAARTGTEQDGNLRILRYFQCWALVGADRFDEASEILEDSISDAQRDHQSWALRIFESWKGVLRAQTGRLPDAAAMLDGKFSPGDARLVVGVIDAVGLAGLGRVRIHLGDERGAREVADMCRVVMDTSAPGPRRHAAWFLASYAMAGGHHLEAHRWLQALGETERLSIFPLFPHDVADEPELVRIAIAAGDDELVAQALHIAARRQRLNPGLRSAAAIAAHVRGLATRGAADLKEAVDQLRSVTRPIALASALEDLGRVRVADGATDEAIKALSEALGIYLAIGASWDAARVRGRLRQLGVRRRVVSHAGPRTGWAALTPAELQVARLVTQGKTNRETAEQLFVSPHTVNAHLRRIFEKTGVRSRVELTRAAAKRAC
jgi:DNA-binding CsgD family transcriptional regulator